MYHFQFPTIALMNHAFITKLLGLNYLLFHHTCYRSTLQADGVLYEFSKSQEATSMLILKSDEKLCDEAKKLAGW